MTFFPASEHPDPVQETRVIALGDIHGSFKSAVADIKAATKEMGRVDAVLCVGDVEANRNARDAAGVATGRGHRRWVGEFPQVLDGRLPIPVPMWFIGGEHEPWQALDVRGPGPLAPNVSFLGRAGVRSVAGLTVGFLSGVYGEYSHRDLGDRLGRDERCCYVDAEVIALKRGVQKKGRIDILLTHDWPSGVLGELGDPQLRELAQHVVPRVHVCGHHHLRVSGLVDGVPVEALAQVGNPGSWIGLVATAGGELRRVA